MEKLLVEFARHADRERYQLHFICLESRGSLADEVEALGWPVEALGTRPGLRPGLILKLARLFRRLRINVVHTHNEAACLYATPAARLARGRVVVNTRHGQGVKPGTRPGRVFALVSRLVDSVVCVSKDSADLASGLGISPHRIAMIWNGIDTERFPVSGPCRQGPAILVSRLSAEKDIRTLIQAVPSVLRRIPQFRLRLVGTGACRPSLEELTAQLGLQQQVEFAGEKRDVAQELRQACMFVLPSLTEGVSLSLLEAMSVGLPIVATRVGGNVEVVEENRTGLLVSPGSPAALAEAIVTLASDPELSYRMGQEGRQRVEKSFDVRRMVRAYEQLYQDCLARRSFFTQRPCGETGSSHSRDEGGGGT